MVLLWDCDGHSWWIISMKRYLSIGCGTVVCLLGGGPQEVYVLLGSCIMMHHDIDIFCWRLEHLNTNSFSANLCCSRPSFGISLPNERRLGQCIFKSFPCRTYINFVPVFKNNFIRKHYTKSSLFFQLLLNFSFGQLTIYIFDLLFMLIVGCVVPTHIGHSWSGMNNTE
jgi:hypothetical protein